MFIESYFILLQSTLFSMILNYISCHLISNKITKYVSYIPWFINCTTYYQALFVESNISRQIVVGCMKEKVAKRSEFEYLTSITTIKHNYSINVLLKDTYINRTLYLFQILHECIQQVTIQTWHFKMYYQYVFAKKFSWE